MAWPQTSTARKEGKHRAGGSRDRKSQGKPQSCIFSPMFYEGGLKAQLLSPFNTKLHVKKAGTAQERMGAVRGNDHPWLQATSLLTVEQAY